MPVPRFEVPTGAVDGVNLDYYVSVPYRAGSTAVFLNGLLQQKALDDGWIEADPSTGWIQMKEAPQGTGLNADIIQVFFIDTSPALPEEVISGITGTLSEDGGEILAGSLEEDGSIGGEVALDLDVAGTIVAEMSLTSVLEPDYVIEGVLQECFG